MSELRPADKKEESGWARHALLPRLPKISEIQPETVDCRLTFIRIFYIVRIGQSIKN
jgi:hypothetical protein